MMLLSAIEVQNTSVARFRHSAVDHGARKGVLPKAAALPKKRRLGMFANSGITVIIRLMECYCGAGIFRLRRTLP